MICGDAHEMLPFVHRDLLYSSGIQRWKVIDNAVGYVKRSVQASPCFYEFLGKEG